jgi:hypothetical protein
VGSAGAGLGGEHGKYRQVADVGECHKTFLPPKQGTNCKSRATSKRRGGLAGGHERVLGVRPVRAVVQFALHTHMCAAGLRRAAVMTRELCSNRHGSS